MMASMAANKNARKGNGIQVCERTELIIYLSLNTNYHHTGSKRKIYIFKTLHIWNKSQRASVQSSQVLLGFLQISVVRSISSCHRCGYLSFCIIKI